MPDTAVTIGPVRFSYANVWKPVSVQGSEPKFSCCVLIPKTAENLTNICKKAINAAASVGVENNKFPKTLVDKGGLRIPIRDGDQEYENGSRGPEYQGHWFINTSNANQPGILDKYKVAVIDESEFYSGCHGYIHINFFPYNTAGNKGVGASLQHLMKTVDDDRLDGRISSDEAFKAVESDAGDVPNDLI